MPAGETGSLRGTWCETTCEGGGHRLVGSPWRGPVRSSLALSTSRQGDSAGGGGGGEGRETVTDVTPFPAF